MATELRTLLVETKVHLYADARAPVSQYKNVWNSFLMEVPQMWKNKEEWLYYHRGMNRTAAGSDALIQEEFESFKKQGFSVQNDCEANELRIYGTLKYQNRTLRYELSFVRWLGDEDENGDAKGQGLCPILYGIGFLADGFTYMRVKITEVVS